MESMERPLVHPSGGFLFETFRLAEEEGKCLNWDSTEFKDRLDKARQQFEQGRENSK
ncbi:MAG: hypothetical protein ACE1ZQ_00870 [Ignavibacteriaceae bacterium]